MSDDKKHILIVEDDLISTKIAVFLFQQAGCTIEHVETGEAAVEFATTKHHLYDGIYLDIGLPIMKGIEVCLRIRGYEAAHAQLVPLPIIAVTANFSKDDADEYLKAGMQEVFFKPLTPEKINHFLKTCSTRPSDHLIFPIRR